MTSRILGTGTAWTLGQDLLPEFHWRGFRFNSADELGSLDAGEEIPCGSHDSLSGVPLPTFALRCQKWTAAA